MAKAGTLAAPIVHHVQTVAVHQLKPHPKNYRGHPDDQIQHLAASIRENGFYRNIVAARDMTVLAGHGVLQAARAEGLEAIQVVVLDLDPDSPRALKILAGDNEVQHLAENDDRALSELLKLVKDTDVSGLLGTGYDAAMLDALLGSVDVPGGVADPLAGMDPGEGRYKEQYGVIVVCADEQEQQGVYERLMAEGLTCRVVVT